MSVTGPFRWLASTPQHRHWTRVGLCLILVVGPALYGALSWPGTPEAPDPVGPKVVILADQPLAATVNMALSVAGQSSELQLTILPTSKITSSVMLTVQLDNFPAGTTGTAGTPKQLPVIHAAANSALASPLQAAPQSPTGYQDYAVNGMIPDQTTPAKINIMTTEKPVGEAISGAQLRVTFPALVGETAGANPSASIPFQSLYTGAQASSGSGYPLALQAGTATFTFQGTPLSDYQFLAGDSPIPLGSQWFWDGINDVTALAANIGTQDADQTQVFICGVAFGVAAGALISFFLELIPADPVKPNQPDPDPNAGIPPA
jgi:hypothetical protein